MPPLSVEDYVLEHGQSMSTSLKMTASLHTQQLSTYNGLSRKNGPHSTGIPTYWDAQTEMLVFRNPRLAQYVVDETEVCGLAPS